MRKLIWLMLLASAWSSAAEKNVTLTPIITTAMIAYSMQRLLAPVWARELRH